MGKVRVVKSQSISKSPSLLKPMYEHPVDTSELENATVNVGSSFPCYYCELRFKKAIARFNHEKMHKKKIAKEKRKQTAHRNSSLLKVYTCPECYEEFSNQRKLTIHKKTHTKTFECLSCGKKFKDRMDLDWHDAINDGLHYKSLNTPVHRTRSQSRLSCHNVPIQRALSCTTNIFRGKETPVLHPSEKIDRNDQQKKRALSSLSLNFRLNDRKKSNDVSYWVNNNKYMSDNDDSDEDDDSDDISDSLSEISIDLSKNNSNPRPATPALSWTSLSSQFSTFGKFICSESNCMKTFPSLAWLTTHEMSEHNKMALFKCIECRKRFTVEENLRQHKIENHPMTIVCLLCDQLLRNSTDYMEHYNLHLKFSIDCHLCGKKFLSKYFLEEHLKNPRLHKTIDKPKCEILIRVDRRSCENIAELNYDTFCSVEGFVDMKYEYVPFELIACTNIVDDGVPWRL